jgi:hypothetical protein
MPACTESAGKITACGNFYLGEFHRHILKRSVNLNPQLKLRHQPEATSNFSSQKSSIFSGWK